MSGNQILQNWILLIHGHDELLETGNGHHKADTTDAIILPDGKDRSLFIFWSDVILFTNAVIDEERKGR
jgi:hypothetical protein